MDAPAPTESAAAAHACQLCGQQRDEHRFVCDELLTDAQRVRLVEWRRSRPTAEPKDGLDAIAHHYASVGV